MVGRHKRWGTIGGTRAAILALLLYVIAPVVHAFVHPDHGLIDPWTEVAQSGGAQAGQAQKSGTAPHQNPQANCQVLTGLSVALPTPIAFAPTADIAPVFMAAMPDAPDFLRPPLRPQGQAPPQIS